MTAGLPGTGIGCLFYLVSALLMPLIEIYMTCRGRSSKQRWVVVGTQLALALGIVASFSATGWCLGWVLSAEHAMPLQGAGEVFNAIAVKSFAISTAVLASVLVAIEIVGLVWRLRDKRRAALAGSPSLS